MRAVEVEANLLATCEKRTVALCASGKSGVLSFSNPELSVVSMFRILPFSARSRQNLLRLHRGCSALGLSLTVEVFDRAVFHLGSQCKPGVFSRLLGLSPVEVRLLPILYTIARVAFTRAGSERKV